MNPLERIEEMKQILKTEVKNNNIKGSDYITQAEHYSRMINMLNVLKEEMKEAEYNYQVESVNHTVQTLDEFVVLQKNLNEDIIIFQPIEIGDSISSTDMHSLVEVLTKLRDSGQIKENILLMPPNVNVLRAKLVQPLSTYEE